MLILLKSNFNEKDAAVPLVGLFSSFAGGWGRNQPFPSYFRVSVGQKSGHSKAKNLQISYET